MNILYCSICKEFTLKIVCHSCSAPTASSAPARFSVQDKYGKYRRQAKVETVE